MITYFTVHLSVLHVISSMRASCRRQRKFFVPRYRRWPSSSGNEAVVLLHHSVLTHSRGVPSVLTIGLLLDTISRLVKFIVVINFCTCLSQSHQTATQQSLTDHYYLKVSPRGYLPILLGCINIIDCELYRIA